MGPFRHLSREPQASAALKGAAPFAGVRGGFTLIELVTVVAILGILVALGLGAIQAVQNSNSRSATGATLRALDGGLAAFYADWKKYPWPTTVSVSITPKTGDAVSIDLGDVASSDINKKFTDPGVTDAAQKQQFALFRGLSLDWRHGPYLRAGAASAVMVPVSSGGSFQAYGDGWGRPIFYDQPVAPHLKPKLTSYGAKGFDSSLSTSDLAKLAITNYDF